MGSGSEADKHLEKFKKFYKFLSENLLDEQTEEDEEIKGTVVWMWRAIEVVLRLRYEKTKIIKP